MQKRAPCYCALFSVIREKRFKIEARIYTVRVYLRSGHVLFSGFILHPIVLFFAISGLLMVLRK